MKEIWKDVNGYEGLYQVSNFGNIRKLRFINNKVNKEKIFKISPQKQNKGYLKVVLYKNGKYKNYLVHRLVASEFISNPNNYKEINHKDGNKENNSTNNLEWCTRSYNNKEAFRTGLKKASSTGKYGGENPKAKKINMLDKKTKKIIKTFPSMIEASQFINKKSSSHICNCCKGKLKSAYGYIWEYSNETI